MKRNVIACLTVLTVLHSCMKIDEDSESYVEDTRNVIEEGPMAGLNVPNNFSFNTSSSATISLKVPEFLRGAGFALHLNANENDTVPMATGSFDERGEFSQYFQFPSTQESITVRSRYVGLIDSITVPIVNGQAVFDYGLFYQSAYSTSGKKLGMTKKVIDSFESNGYTFLSTFDSEGVPNNLMAPDTIERSLLDDVNASLPERQRLPNVHPEYLAGKETNLILTEESDVWVTFLSENAGWRNSLGYYTYPVGEEPTSIEEIDTHYIIFPNISMRYSGGGLVPGDKVHLGRFPANTVVSWFLVAQGYTGNGVGDGIATYYSQPEFNEEADDELKKHMVMLYDATRELTILAFEDVPRDRIGCDQDFNDAIFYATSNPVDAIKVDNVAKVAVANDEDNDGINDELDDFPNDINLAFVTHVPAADSRGTLAFEDLWPSKGDFDFNDLVVSYHYKLISNANHLVTKIETNFKVEHIGASFNNGFAITFPIAPSTIEIVENQLLTNNYIVVNSNGTESGTAADETVIVIADDTQGLVGMELNIDITFNSPIDRQSLGPIPFNPFMMVDGIREKEVHLPDFRPTSKAAFLGEGNDDSDATINRFYKTDENIPWALHIYHSFDPPQERTPITVEYPRFKAWANSGGEMEQDWFIK